MKLKNLIFKFQFYERVILTNGSSHHHPGGKLPLNCVGVEDSFFPRLHKTGVHSLQNREVRMRNRKTLGDHDLWMLGSSKRLSERISFVNKE